MKNMSWNKKSESNDYFKKIKKKDESMFISCKYNTTRMLSYNDFSKELANADTQWNKIKSTKQFWI